MKVWSVSEITGHIKVLFNADPTLARLAIRGEISNLSTGGAGGHAYFVLKDGRCQMNAVMWSSKMAVTPVRPQNGTRVVAIGRVTIYDAAGRYQLMVEELRSDGGGDLYAQFLRLKEKLAAEGLFDDDRKQPLPAFPRLVGLVTSPTGAAVQDMIRILRQRCPGVKVLLAPAVVQGDEAPYSLIGALHRLVKFKPDVIVMGRGGGSFEELNAFNHEGLARAVSSCTIPVVSAVGHESDFTILDLVADVRAPTPTAAATQVVPDQVELQRRLVDLERRLGGALKRRLQRDQARLKAALGSPALRYPDRLLESRRQRLDDVHARLWRAWERTLLMRRQRLDRGVAKLTALDPESVLGRG
ncbi:MAG TPA: exodeoxyribonuclease VII large subunit, partial [Candidatus Xenobia bacterium]